MRSDTSPLTHCLIFPVAPIAVIVATSILCADIWQAAYYTPGADGGEAEPAIAMLVIPLLLIIVAGLLAATTAIKRWIDRRYAPGKWWRVLMAVPRVLLALGSLLLFVVSTGFFMGEPLAGFRHWQVACSWVFSVAFVVTFGAQQYQRLVE